MFHSMARASERRFQCDGWQFADHRAVGSFADEHVRGIMLGAVSWHGHHRFVAVAQCRGIARSALVFPRAGVSRDRRHMPEPICHWFGTTQVIRLPVRKARERAESAVCGSTTMSSEPSGVWRSSSPAALPLARPEKAAAVSVRQPVSARLGEVDPRVVVFGEQNPRFTRRRVSLRATRGRSGRARGRSASAGRVRAQVTLPR